MKDQDQDFQDFLNSKNISPPEQISANVLTHVKSDLDPSHLTVFSKLMGIQAFIGLLTLTFCPQFNLSLTNNYELFHLLHHTFGESVCMAICGSIFIGSGAIFASYLLSLGEIRKIKESKFLYYLLISSIAVLTFIFLGADIYLKLTLFWFIGASLAGALLFELNWNLRLKMIVH
ncbi:hypothetical protein OAQ84_00850 [Bdellovibrionales bacterium]|nr:hypothetical protein [Bdellovibrionales bacterium]